MTSAEAREIALREVELSPGIRQRELAERLHEATGRAPSTMVKLLRALEREGVLESGLEGRRKVYRLAEPGVSHGSRRELLLLVALALGLAALAVLLLPAHTWP